MPNSAAAVAVATPCWPAPVSAIRRRLPIRRANRACPITLLSLCDPVWARSSRLRNSWTPSSAESRSQRVIGVGPTPVVLEGPVELLPEPGVAPGPAEGLFELEARRHQRLGYEATAELSEPAARAGVPHDLGGHYSFCQSNRPA